MTLLLVAAAARAATVADVRAHRALVVLCYPDTGSAFLQRGGDGAYAGVDVSILRSFAVSLHVPLVVREVKRFEDLLPALAKGDGDVAAGGLSITPARQRLADFTAPYFPVAVMVIARQQSGIRGLSDLAGKRGAAVPGTTHEALMREMGLVPATTLTRAGLAYDALRQDRADFAFVDSTSGVVSLEKFPGVVKVGMLPKPDYYGFAVAKGSDLRAALDRHLVTIREAGLLYKIFERHLGPKAVDLYELFRKSTGSAPYRLP